VVVKPFSSTYSLTESGVPTSTTLSYRFRFRNGDGIVTATSPSKDVISGPPPAPAPTGLAGSALTPFSIQWSWDNFGGADSFVLHDAAHNQKASANAGMLSQVESALGENSLNVRHLHAIVAGWESNASTAVARYTLVHDALTSDLVPSPVSTDAIDVSIVAPPQGGEGLSGCLIERSSDGASWTVIKPFSNVYFVRDSGLSQSSAYFYRVTFRNGDGIAGLPSPSVSISTLSIPRPLITTAPKKTRNRNTGVRGTAQPGLTVVVLFNGIPDGSLVADAAGQWSYSATTKYEGTYLVTARASNGSETTGDSSPVAITVDLTPPPPPSHIRSTGYNNAIDVEWDPNPVPDLAGYLIYRKEVGTNTWDTLNPRLVVGSKYRDATAVNGRRYAFKVVAVDDSRND
jgi:hypothetical protein